MSYFKRDSGQSPYLADRVPVYVFPAMVGSGRILLSMALTGTTTAVLLHSGAVGSPLYLALGVVSYTVSLILAITGIYAINAIPQRTRPAPGTAARPPLSAQRLAPPLSQGATSAPALTSDREKEHRTRLDDLLVKRWQLVTEEQLHRARAMQATSGHSLVAVLSRMGLLTDGELERILTLQAAAADPWHHAPRKD